jgi:hypothetical protein
MVSSTPGPARATMISIAVESMQCLSFFNLKGLKLAIVYD